MSDKYSPHFSKKEFACKCCGQNGPIDLALVDSLEVLRVLVGKPIIITSGYRCPKHNAEIGGAKNSQHTKGTAADIKSPGATPLELFALAAQIPAIKGLGLYEGWVHIDVRDAPRRVVWKG